MDKKQAITTLYEKAPALRKLGARSLYLFGSTAKGTARDDSDVDIFIEPDTSRPFTLINLITLKRYLSRSLHRPVDLTTRDSLHPALKRTIQKSAIKVF